MIPLSPIRVGLFTALSCAAVLGQAPPAYFEVEVTYESMYVNGRNGYSSVVYCAGTAYGPFGDAKCELQPPGPPRTQPKIVKSSANGSLAVDTTGYGQGVVIANMSFGASTASGALRTAYDWVNNNNSFGQDNWSLNANFTLRTYVRGSPGTQFHLIYSFPESVLASISKLDCVGGNIGANFSSPRSVGARASSAGQTDAQNNIGTATVIDSATGSQTKTYMGSLYTLAHTLPIGMGASTSAYGQCNPNAFTGNTFAQGSLALSVNIVRSGQQPPTSRIVGPTTAAINSTAPFSGLTSSDPDGSIVEYRWTVQTPSGNVTQLGPTLNYTWTAQGTYQVLLTVTDDDGLRDTTSVFVNVGGCAIDLRPPSATFGPAGGTGSFTLTTDSQCDWTASSTVGWARILSRSSGRGSGFITYAIDLYSGGVSTRHGEISVGGRSHSIEQRAAGKPDLTTRITGFSNFIPDNIPEITEVRIQPGLKNTHGWWAVNLAAAVSLEVSNSGSTASSPTRLGLRLRIKDTTIEHELTSFNIPAIAPGQTYTLPFLSGGIAPLGSTFDRRFFGETLLMAKVDSGNLVDEVDEVNNSFAYDLLLVDPRPARYLLPNQFATRQEAEDFLRAGFYSPPCGGPVPCPGWTKNLQGAPIWSRRDNQFKPAFAFRMDALIRRSGASYRILYQGQTFFGEPNPLFFSLWSDLAYVDGWHDRF